MSIKAINLSIGYPSKCILDNINCELHQGSFSILIGGNGKGKSTLLRTLAGLQAPFSGSIIINNRNLKDLSPSELAKELSLVTTDSTNAGGLRVHELVAMGRYPFSGFFGQLSTDDRHIVCESIKAVGLENKKDAFIGYLSDGERQKAMIARAMAQTTQTIIFDEPTSFLDVSARHEIISLLKHLAKIENKAILSSTHDVGLALAHADNLWVIADNRLIIGTAEDLYKEGTLDKVFPNMKFSMKKMDFIPR